MNILDRIIAEKKIEVQRRKETISIKLLEQQILDAAPIVSFRQALLDSDTGIIAEFKRKSPSKDWIFKDADATQTVLEYEASGASAVSILTDNPFFGGNENDLKLSRTLVKLPLLRKDFMIDEYQLYEAKVWGANVILLIASALTPARTMQLASTARSIGLEVLLEIHSDEELGHINEYVDVVGINNRNLSTFVTDIATSFDLGQKIPADVVKISESGISDPQTVKDLRAEGFKGFLMGENFMKTHSPGKALADFIKALKV